MAAEFGRGTQLHSTSVEWLDGKMHGCSQDLQKAGVRSRQKARPLRLASVLLRKPFAIGDLGGAKCLPDDGEAGTSPAVHGEMGVVGVSGIPPPAFDSPEKDRGLLAASRRPSMNLAACVRPVSQPRLLTAAAQEAHPTAMLSIIIASGPSCSMSATISMGAVMRHPRTCQAMHRLTQQRPILVVTGDGEIDLQGRAKG